MVVVGLVRVCCSGGLFGEDPRPAEILDGLGFEVLEGNFAISVGVQDFLIGFDVALGGFECCVRRHLRIWRCW